MKKKEAPNNFLNLSVGDIINVNTEDRKISQAEIKKLNGENTFSIKYINGKWAGKTDAAHIVHIESIVKSSTCNNMKFANSVMIKTLMRECSRIIAANDNSTGETRLVLKVWQLITETKSIATKPLFSKPIPPVQNIGNNKLSEVDASENQKEEFDNQESKSIKFPDVKFKKAPKGNATPQKKSVEVYIYERDPEVVTYALQRAKGHCEKCKQPAPFRACLK